MRSNVSNVTPRWFSWNTRCCSFRLEGDKTVAFGQAVSKIAVFRTARAFIAQWITVATVARVFDDNRERLSWRPVVWKKQRVVNVICRKIVDCATHPPSGVGRQLSTHWNSQVRFDRTYVGPFRCLAKSCLAKIRLAKSRRKGQAKSGPQNCQPGTGSRKTTTTTAAGPLVSAVIISNST